MEIPSYNRHGGYHQQERSYARSPLSKAATMGFAYVPQQQSPYHSAAPQPQASSPRSYVNDGFSSLPRPNRNGERAAPRRKAVNSALQGYFKSLNSMARSIVLEKETVEKEHECQWKSMDDAAKEEAVNDHFIPQDIRIQYSFDFPIDRSVSRSSYCSMPSGCPARPHSAHSMHDGILLEDSHASLHLSQPSDWDGHRRQLGSSQEELASREHNLVHSSHALSLSQPSLSYSYDNVETTSTQTFNRLHKQQLSFRPSRKQHAVKKLSHTVTPKPSRLPPASPRRSLGSDGESTRTSDEDFEIRNRPHIPPETQLGFQRNKLRSYSMRSRRGSGANRNTNSARGSMRTPRRKSTTPESNCKNHLTPDQPSQPSHYHTYSSTSTDTDYDAEIDLPEPSLLLDHLQSAPEKQSDSRLYRRNSRTRRSLKGAPKLVLNQPSPPGTLDRHTPLHSSADDLDDDIDESIIDEPLHRADSQDSLRAATPSSKSYVQSDDDALSTTASEMSRLTPDSMLSCGSYRTKSKQTELAVLRNRRGKWGGSSYRRVTSNFADRHTQFKPNMLRSPQTSASTTRAPSPIEYTSGQSEEELLKPPRFSKYNSATESVTSDLPHSPDQLSQFISPPVTPSHLRNATYLFSDKRESGYISSSSESFQIGAKR